MKLTGMEETKHIFAPAQTEGLGGDLPAKSVSGYKLI